MAKAHVKVKGRVQGVFYRQSTRAAAEKLGLSGWVRNLTDGSVEAEIKGPKDKVEELILWLRSGPPSARVDRVEVDWVDEESAAPNHDNGGRFEIW